MGTRRRVRTESMTRITQTATIAARSTSCESTATAVYLP